MVKIFGEAEIPASDIIFTVSEIMKNRGFIDNIHTTSTLISMYYVISIKRGNINPIISIADFLDRSNFLSGNKCIEYKNPAMISKDDGGISKCETWIEGITLHVDTISTMLNADGYPRTDTPVLEMLDTKSNDEMYILSPNGVDIIYKLLKRDNPNIMGDGILLNISNDTLIATMSDKGYIKDTEYWKNVISGKISPSSDNVRSLFIKIATQK